MSQVLRRFGRGFSLSLAIVLLLSGAFSQVFAGGGPENVVVVVNSHSPNSMTLANHYVKLRNIPPGNVISLDYRGAVEAIGGGGFRQLLLNPILKAIDERKLGPQVDYVVYSCDFPWRVELQNEYPQEKFTKSFMPHASINGATYLWAYILKQSPAIVMPMVNYYVPGPADTNLVQCEALAAAESHGFRGRYLWKKGGEKTTDPKQGQRYLLSTMLGVTSGRGNKPDEILSYLQRAVLADGKQPTGTFYYMKNSDVRSTTRDRCYMAAAAQLQRLGAKVEVLTGVLPNGKRDVLGIMTGAENLDFANAHMQIMPGAICEHLTSYGGELRMQSSQTPLTEFLRHGATASSGTVIEPTAQQAKFPLPNIHVHYRRGCSLAESFYQSVRGPYQLLIVGDPLCQPWAVPPKVELDLKPNTEVAGLMSVTPKVSAGTGKQVGTCEVFIDGRLVITGLPADKTITFNTLGLPDGHHELRVVAANADSIESQGRAIVPFVVANNKQKVELKVTPQGGISASTDLKFTLSAPGASSIVLRHQDRELGTVTGENGELTVRAGRLGRGPVFLIAHSKGAEESSKEGAVSKPVPLWID